MASREKSNLNIVLVNAYERALSEYAALYPTAPQPFITCTYRSNVEQNELYTQGRTKPGKIVTNAKAGQSPHNYLISAAFDIAFISVNKKLDWSSSLFVNFAEIIKAIEPRVAWGGEFKTFKDTPHFELKEWRKYV